jgi:hypothetical protein
MSTGMGEAIVQSLGHPSEIIKCVHTLAAYHDTTSVLEPLAQLAYHLCACG